MNTKVSCFFNISWEWKDDIFIYFKEQRTSDHFRHSLTHPKRKTDSKWARENRTTLRIFVHSYLAKTKKEQNDYCLKCDLSPYDREHLKVEHLWTKPIKTADLLHLKTIWWTYLNYSWRIRWPEYTSMKQKHSVLFWWCPL